ncbi:hypothetical protein [Streptomyces sp. SP18BB07]|uniref:hypothetical protein n=1 Tax=Streptomyces sp. SP18BB07 TaxID=3002522 RepID=UPI002E7660B4|nr:hypothetical protein [Streptomyces sp. SP18BB07]MEE1764442.1 hypothetical protein [Streptomyces sp. SP18BB07]
MSTPPLDKIAIEVGDFPLDGAVIKHKGKTTLFLRPQAFSTAVRHVRNVLPHITLEAAENLVREQCPEFPDFDELLGLTELPAPSIERPADPPEREDTELGRRKWRHRAVVVAALVPALAASWALGRYTTVADTTSSDATASALDTASSPGDLPESLAPFEEPNFSHFAGAGNIDCNPTNPLEAECTDADGMVMSTKAATGPDSTIFTFSYGSERVGLRIFYDVGYVDTWARQDGTKELYPNLQVHGRYVLWGTDPERIKEYGDLLDQDAKVAPTPLGSAKPLPPRLAALTLGTLGLGPQQVNRIIATPASAATDGPVTVAARMVLGLDTEAAHSTPAGDDIVALAAGIEPKPPVVIGTGSKPVPVVPRENEPVPVVPAPRPTHPPTTVPAPDTNTPAEPSEPTPAQPTPSDPPAAEAPVEEEPSTPATEEPTAEEPAPTTPETPEPAPADPVETTPDAPETTEPANPPVEVPPPAEDTPAQEPEVPSADSEAHQNGHGQDDLLILASAWTVGP